MTTNTHRRGFSLVELLVVITLIVMLVAMMATALNAARASGAKQKTRASIAMLNEIIQRHYRSTESMSMPADVAATGRGAAIRRQITADMPDSWQEVEYLKNHPDEFKSARHRGYVATYDAVNPTTQNASAECLFMIVMQGGLADCLDCSGLGSIPVGDTDGPDVNGDGVPDGDGAPEFLDAWGKPIRYVLWPGGFQLPPGGDAFFDGSVAPFDGAASAAPGGTMRPLIVSVGPSIRINPSASIDEDPIKYFGDSYLELGGAQCGNPAHSSISPLGGHDTSRPDRRIEILTNFDDEVRK